MLRRISIIFTGALLFISCTKPGEEPTAIAQKTIEDMCKQQSQGDLKVVNFVKTDAVAEKRDGVDYYKISCEFEVEGTKDAPEKFDDGMLMVPGRYLDICRRHGKYGAVMSFEVRDRPNDGDCFVFPVEKGHYYKVDNNRLKHMTLSKHESGWVVVQWGT